MNLDEALGVVMPGYALAAVALLACGLFARCLTTGIANWLARKRVVSLSALEAVGSLLVIPLLLVMSARLDARPANPSSCMPVVGFAAFRAACDQYRQTASVNPSAYVYEDNFSCNAGGQFGMRPACGWWRTSNNLWASTSALGGDCPNGTPGPGVDWEGAVGETPPTEWCNGGCRVSSEPPCAQTEVNGMVLRTCQTTYTGVFCVSANPGDEPTADNDPEDCPPALQIGGKCINLNEDGEPEGGDDGDGVPEPVVCLGPLCNEVPPHPNHGPDCATGGPGAVCVGPAGGGSAPAPPSPPYPPNATPAVNTSLQSSAAGASGTNITFHAPPNGPPDPGEDGTCEGGATPTGPSGSCVCPVEQYWNGSQCTTGEEEPCDPEVETCEDGDGREAETGSCAAAPMCSGDEIDCSVVYQTWATRCALRGDEDPPYIDLDSDPFDSIGGVDTLFEEGEDDEWSPIRLDQSGFLGTAACPTLDPIDVFGHIVTIPPVWCDLDWIRWVVLVLALIISLRIIAGE